MLYPGYPFLERRWFFQGENHDRVLTTWVPFHLRGFGEKGEKPHTSDLTAATRNRRNHQHFIPILKAVLLIPQKADVFLIHIEVDKAPDLPVVSTQMRPQRREPALDIGDQLGQIRGRAVDL